MRGNMQLFGLQIRIRGPRSRRRSSHKSQASCYLLSCQLLNLVDFNASQRASSWLVMINSSDAYCLTNLELVAGLAAVNVLISSQRRKECFWYKERTHRAPQTGPSVISLWLVEGVTSTLCWCETHSTQANRSSLRLPDVLMLKHI